jgi:hypothetical protein
MRKGEPTVGMKKGRDVPGLVAEFTSRKDQSAAMSPSSSSADLTGIR